MSHMGNATGPLATWPIILMLNCDFGQLEPSSFFCLGLEPRIEPRMDVMDLCDRAENCILTY